MQYLLSYFPVTLLLRFFLLLWGVYKFKKLLFALFAEILRNLIVSKNYTEHLCSLIVILHLIKGKLLFKFLNMLCSIVESPFKLACIEGKLLKIKLFLAFRGLLFNFNLFFLCNNGANKIFCCTFSSRESPNPLYVSLQCQYPHTLHNNRL